MRRLTVLLAFAGGFFAVGALLRRTTGRGRERVDLYYADGSMKTLVDGSADSARLLDLAREAIHAARA
jgi:hypothetical protein